MSRQAYGQLRDLADAFRGVTVTIATPFFAGSLDLNCNALSRNLQVVAASGISVIVPAGNTGEYHNLTVAEVRTVTERTIREVAGRTAVVMGVGGDVRTAIAQAQFAQHAGAHGVLLHEPHHTFVSDDGLARYYQEICRAIEIGVALYKRTPRLSDQLLVRLARECPNVVAIKYAWNDVAAYLSLVKATPAHVVCACGSAERWALPFSAAGTTGFTSGIANFAPDLSLRYWQALRTDRAKADALWQLMAPLEAIRGRLDSAFNVPVVKHAMSLVGLESGPPRPPLSPLGERLQEEVRQILQDWPVQMVDTSVDAMLPGRTP